MGLVSEPLFMSIILFGIVIAVLLVASAVSRYAGADRAAAHLLSLRFGFLGFVITLVVVRMPPPGSRGRTEVLDAARRRMRIAARRKSGPNDRFSTCRVSAAGLASS